MKPVTTTIAALLAFLPTAVDAACTIRDLRGWWQLFETVTVDVDEGDPQNAYTISCRVRLNVRGEWKREDCSEQWQTFPEEWQFRGMGATVEPNCAVVLTLPHPAGSARLEGQVSPSKEIIAGVGTPYDEPGTIQFQMVRITR